MEAKLAFSRSKRQKNLKASEHCPSKECLDNKRTLDERDRQTVIPLIQTIKFMTNALSYLQFLLHSFIHCSKIIIPRLSLGKCYCSWLCNLLIEQKDFHLKVLLNVSYSNERNIDKNAADNVTVTVTAVIAISEKKVCIRKSNLGHRFCNFFPWHSALCKLQLSI